MLKSLSSTQFKLRKLEITPRPAAAARLPHFLCPCPPFCSSHLFRDPRGPCRSGLLRGSPRSRGPSFTYARRSCTRSHSGREGAARPAGRRGGTPEPALPPRAADDAVRPLRSAQQRSISAPSRAWAPRRPRAGSATSRGVQRPGRLCDTAARQRQGPSARARAGGGASGSARSPSAGSGAREPVLLLRLLRLLSCGPHRCGPRRPGAAGGAAAPVPPAPPLRLRRERQQMEAGPYPPPPRHALGTRCWSPSSR